MNLMSLWRHQSAPAVDLAGGPSRVDQVAMTVDPEELEGAVADTRPTRFPMPDGSNTDVEELGGLLAIKATENASIAELTCGDDAPSRLLA